MRHNLQKKHLLELTLAVYKVTAIFPDGKEGDNLGSKIRELADKILLNQNENTSRSIDEILELFDLAEKKNWVDPRNFSVLKREYENIRQFRAPYEGAQLTVHLRKVHKDSDRQNKILAVMTGNGALKIGDLVRIFPGVNRRTVLRDLDELCQSGVMVRNGHGRGAYYVKNGLKCDMSQ